MSNPHVVVIEGRGPRPEDPVNGHQHLARKDTGQVWYGDGGRWHLVAGPGAVASRATYEMVTEEEEGSVVIQVSRNNTAHLFINIDHADNGIVFDLTNVRSDALDDFTIVLVPSLNTDIAWSSIDPADPMLWEGGTALTALVSTNRYLVRARHVVDTWFMSYQVLSAPP